MKDEKIQDKTYKVGINRHFTNKDVTNHNHITYGFENVELSISRLIDGIKAGYSFYPGLLRELTKDEIEYHKYWEDKEGKPVKRKYPLNFNFTTYKAKMNENFVSSSLLVLDIDNKNDHYWAHVDAVVDEFLRENASFIYTTPSHTEEHNRFRVVFELPKEVIPYSEYENLLKSFKAKFADRGVDSGCGVANCYFGSKGCEVTVFGQTLPADVIQSVLREYGPKTKTKTYQLATQANVNGKGKEKYLSKVLNDALTDVRSSIRGDRHNSFVRSGAKIGNYAHWWADDGEAAFREVSQAVAGRTDYEDPKEAQTAFRDGFKIGKSKPKPIKDDFGNDNGFNQSHRTNRTRNEPSQTTEHLTDLGNAGRFVGQHSEICKFANDTGRWYIWNGKVWNMDNNTVIFRKAESVVKSIYSEAAEADDSDRRKSLASWAKRSESKKSISDMIFLASKKQDVEITLTEFDRDPMALNCQNGIIDLHTGKIKPHSKSENHTKMIPVGYNPKATCSSWLNFLWEIMGGERDNKKAIEMMVFLQRAIGYTLTGNTSEQCLFFLYGSGANGKSTFINTISALMGEYGRSLKIDSLLTKRFDSIPNDLATLPGARFVVSSEIPENRRLHESLVKDLTGGDKINARFMRAEWFDFYPVFKLWLFGNHKPTIRGTDDGIWRRIKLIPFTERIPESRQDKSLSAKLIEELPGILSWAVQGAVEWGKTELQTPTEVTAATNQYRSEQDELAGFFDEHCIVEAGAKVSTKDLYDRFYQWCNEEGVKPESVGIRSKQKFNNRVLERYPQVVKGKGTDNLTFFFGIGLKNILGF